MSAPIPEPGMHEARELAINTGTTIPQASWELRRQYILEAAITATTFDDLKAVIVAHLEHGPMPR